MLTDRKSWRRPLRLLNLIKLFNELFGCRSVSECPGNDRFDVARFVDDEIIESHLLVAVRFRRFFVFVDRECERCLGVCQDLLQATDSVLLFTEDTNHLRVQRFKLFELF